MTAMPPHAPPPSPGISLKIGETAVLTGVSQGRIRHYQRLGLVQPRRSPSRYRIFDATELVKILEIDLLRSLGMGLDEIKQSLPGAGDPRSLKESLARHRESLRTEQHRLQQLITAVDLALEAPDASPESMAAFLASARSSPRDSLGIFGRLSRPLSPDAAATYQRILGGGWGLPVPPILGRLLLPPEVTEVMEQLAGAAGFEELFRRIHQLAGSIMELAVSASPALAADVGRDWVARTVSDPLPHQVQAALDATVPRIRELTVLNQGFQLWAQSISGAAGEVLEAIETEASSRGLVVLAVLVARPGVRRKRAARLRR